MKAHVDGNDGVKHRSARLFAGTYAAAMEARRRNCLPMAFRPMDIVLSCYKLCLEGEAVRPPFADHLGTLIASGKILTITPGADRDIQIAAAEAALGTCHALATHREVRMRQDKARLAFADWAPLQKTDEVRALIICDGANLRPWSHLAPGMDRERLFRFKLPRPQEESLFGASTELESGSAAPAPADAIDDGWADLDTDE